MESRKSLGCELNPQWHLMNMRGTSRQHQENHEQETFENIKNLRFHSDGLCLFFLMHPHTNLVVPHIVTVTYVLRMTSTFRLDFLPLVANGFWIKQRYEKKISKAKQDRIT